MPGATFSVGVSDHIMVAHSLRGEVFGPAQRLHGATYEVRVEVFAPTVDADSIVVDIGMLKPALRAVLAELDYQNLDRLEELAHLNTTTEALARWIHERLAASLPAGRALRLRTTLIESPTAWAAYEAPVDSAGEREA